ncbi:MAG: S8 family serine peptidase [Deltaproteobacteria bacterium]|nr:S8 family serine peptidase [Deltaproteobacteria bacterium]
MVDDIHSPFCFPYERALSLIASMPPNSKIDLFGGEPTLHPKFLDLLAYAMSRQTECSVATNGRLFSRRSFAKRVARITRSSLYIRTSLHGATAKSHEAVTNVPGSFQQLMDGLDNIVSECMPCQVNMVITRKNLMDSEGFTRYLSPGRVLVAYHPGARQSLINRINELPDNYEIVNQSRYGEWLIVRLQAGQDMGGAIDFFNQMPEVHYSEPLFYGINDSEDSPMDGLGWNLEAINIDEAWDYTKGSPSVVVAVIDGKPSLKHPAFPSTLEADIRQEYFFSNAPSFSSHSTQIFGIFAGTGNGISGICPKAHFLPLIVRLEAQYYSQRAEAIHYLSEIQKSNMLDGQPISRVVANCSWKTSGDVAVIREAIRAAASNGVVFVTSAGNTNDSGAHYPSDYSKIIDGVLSVAALSPDDRKAVYSNYSPTVSISAPGGAGLPLDADDIYCPDLNDSYSYGAGTSLAAPHVAGAIALPLSAHPGMDFQTIKGILDRTALIIKEKNPDTWNMLGAGKLDVGVALREASRVMGPNRPEPEPTDDTVQPEREPKPTADTVEIKIPSPSSAGETPPGPKITITHEPDGHVADPDEGRKMTQDILQRVGEEIQRLIGCEHLVRGVQLRVTLEFRGCTTVMTFPMTFREDREDEQE